MTQSNVNYLQQILGSDFTVRLNKADNVDVTYIARKNTLNVHYVFNPQPNGKILIRRHSDNSWIHGCKSIHIIGVKYCNRKQINGGYKKGGWETKEIDWDNTGFVTFEEAADYFVKYTKKFNKYLAA